MSEQFYFDDSDISNEVFDGEPVPGDNTISKPRNLMLKRKARDIINGIYGIAAGSIMTDTYFLLKQFGLQIYKRVLDDDKAPPITDADNFMIRLIARRYNKPPLYIKRPSDDY